VNPDHAAQAVLFPDLRPVVAEMDLVAEVDRREGAGSGKRVLKLDDVSLGSIRHERCPKSSV
jgi:hypothetical protein